MNNRCESPPSSTYRAPQQQRQRQQLPHQGSWSSLIQSLAPPQQQERFSPVAANLNNGSLRRRGRLQEVIREVLDIVGDVDFEDDDDENMM